MHVAPALAVDDNVPAVQVKVAEPFCGSLASVKVTDWPEDNVVPVAKDAEQVWLVVDHVREVPAGTVQPLATQELTVLRVLPVSDHAPAVEEPPGNVVLPAGQLYDRVLLRTCSASYVMLPEYPAGHAWVRTVGSQRYCCVTEGAGHAVQAPAGAVEGPQVLSVCDQHVG